MRVGFILPSLPRSPDSSQLRRGRARFVDSGRAWASFSRPPSHPKSVAIRSNRAAMAGVHINHLMNVFFGFFEVGLRGWRFAVRLYASPGAHAAPAGTGPHWGR